MRSKNRVSQPPLVIVTISLMFADKTRLYEILFIYNHLYYVTPAHIDKKVTVKTGYNDTSVNTRNSIYSDNIIHSGFR